MADFIFLAHWQAERMATTERLAWALSRAGHRILHFVAPTRSPFKAMRYWAAGHPIRSFQLWDPFARDKPSRTQRWFPRATVQAMLSLHRFRKYVLVLQSHWLVPLAESLRPALGVYAALDEFEYVDSTPASEWSDAIFCCSPYSHRILSSRYPDKRVVNLGQCGRSAHAFGGSKSRQPTIVYVGGDWMCVRPELLREVATLPAILLLVGMDRRAAARVWGSGIPENVRPVGWLVGPEFEAAVSQAWVGIVPYDERHARAIGSHPDKAYDYLLAGCTVVSTPVEALIGQPGIEIVEPAAFRLAVQKALQSYSTEVSKRQRRLGVARSAEAYAQAFLDRVVSRSTSPSHGDLGQVG